MKKPKDDVLQPQEAKSKQRRRNKGMCLQDLPVLEPNAAGIDVGAREMFVAVPPGRDEKPVQVFATFTEDLQRYLFSVLMLSQERYLIRLWERAV
jgi:hypothetical protein